MKILISLVSKEVLPAYYSIAEFKPDKIYLIGTNESTDGMKRVASIAKKIGSVNQYKVNAYDIEECRKVCEEIHKDNGSDCEYIYNLTLGTKTMAFGAMSCALSHKDNARMVYTTPAECLNIETFEKTPLTCKLTFEQMFDLQGQKLIEHNEYVYNNIRTECSKDIKTFILEYRKPYEVLANEYRKYTQIRPEFYDRDTTLTRRGNITSIEYKNVEVFSAEIKGLNLLLFGGRWWETLVANATAQWADNRFEIWTSVKFEPNANKNNGSKKIKNEIDVLVNLGTTMLFVECKSGKVAQEDITKLNYVRQTYGSYQSKAVIVSFHTLDQELHEKATDSNIDIIETNNGDLSSLPKELDRIINTLKA